MKFTFSGVSHPDEEEGEAEPTVVKYNPDKLISFPGFNVDVPRQCYDVRLYSIFFLKLWGNCRSTK